MQAYSSPPSPSSEPDARKAALRQEMLRLRAGISGPAHARHSRAAQERILTLDAWQAATEILCYCAVRSELDTRLLLEDAWARGVRLLLPRCVPTQPGVMDVACACDAADLQPGAFNIPEPDPARCPAVGACTPDVAVLPGVAFDRAGRRLGYGGGYYDRLLTAGQARPGLCIGLCFSVQLVDALPADPWDAPVHVIVTESEVVWISK